MHVHNNAEDPRTEPGALWLQGEAGSLDPVLKLMKPNIRLSDSTLKTFEPFCGLFYDALRPPENKEGFFFLVLSVCRNFRFTLCSGAKKLIFSSCFHVAGRS